MNGISAMRIVAMFATSCHKAGFNINNVSINELFTTLVNLEARNDGATPRLFLLKTPHGALNWTTRCDNTVPIVTLTINSLDSSISVLITIETCNRQVTYTFQWDNKNYMLPNEMVLGAIERCILDYSPISCDIALMPLDLREDYAVNGKFDKGSFTITFYPYFMTIVIEQQNEPKEHIIIKYSMVVNYISCPKNFWRQSKI